MIYVVLGMHKSGTTLVSQILHHSGINMGAGIDAQLSYDRGNKYERVSTWQLNDSILGSEDLLSLDIVAPEDPTLTETQRQRMQAIIRECNHTYLDWGFKDPRTCLVYPLWAEELPAHRVIAIYRPLEELWLRYRSQKWYRRYRDFNLAWKLVQRWHEHNGRILNYCQNSRIDCLVLQYSRLMSDDQEFLRLQRFVGRELHDKRRIELYRHHSSGMSLPLSFANWYVKRTTRQDARKIAAALDVFHREQSVPHAEIWGEKWAIG